MVEDRQSWEDLMKAQSTAMNAVWDNPVDDVWDTVGESSQVEMLPKRLMRFQPFRDRSLVQNQVFNSRIDGDVMTVEYGAHHPRGALMRHKAMKELLEQSEGL